GNDKPYRVEMFGNDVDSIRIVVPETQLSERKLLQVTIIPNVDTQFVDEKRVSLFEFLPENTLLWFEDPGFCRERIIETLDDVEAFVRLQEEAKNSQPPPSRTRLSNAQPEEYDKLQKANVSISDFTDLDTYDTSIVNRHLLVWGHGAELPSATGAKSEIEFHTKEQPAFNRQFDL